MSDLLSSQIGAFRDEWARFRGGVTLSDAVVDVFEALLAAFQAQAAALEERAALHASALLTELPIDDCIAMARSDIAAIDAVVRRLAEARVRLSRSRPAMTSLRPSNVVALSDARRSRDEGGRI